MQIAEIQDALRQEGLDGWLFFDHHERDALAYRILELQPGRTVTRRWYYFIPQNGEPRALLHKIEPNILDGVPGTRTLYSGWQSQRESLKTLLQGSHTIAMQYSPDCAIPYVSMVDAGTIELIRGLGLEIVTSANLVQLFEARWSTDQLDSHLAAGKLVDAVRRAAFEHIASAHRAHQTVSELDVQRFIKEAFKKEGLFFDHGPIVAVNANMSNPHYEPDAKHNSPIQKGDAVLLDMWGKLETPRSVYYDITWTGFCGNEPPSDLVNVFEVVRDARDRAVSVVQKSVDAKTSLQGYEVDDAARSLIIDKGYGDYFVHRTGHSIGQEVHGTGANMDNLETHDERRIIPRTCFSIEPGVYLPRFGIRSEVNVYVGENEAIVTGEKQMELVQIT